MTGRRGGRGGVRVLNKGGCACVLFLVLLSAVVVFRAGLEQASHDGEHTCQTTLLASAVADNNSFNYGSMKLSRPNTASCGAWSCRRTLHAEHTWSGADGRSVRVW